MNDNQKDSALTSLIAQGKSQGYLIRAAATAMLSVEQFAEDERKEILEMISDMRIPVVEERLTAADLAALRAPHVRPAPKSTVSGPTVGQPIGPPVAVLSVSAEGGRITLVAQELETGSRYRYTMLDQTDLWLDEGRSEMRGQSAWVYEWSDALAAIDKYPGTLLRPLTVHPQFADRVLRAARERLIKANSSMRALEKLSDWSTLCHI